MTTATTTCWAIAEVARFIGVSTRTIRRWHEKGLIPKAKNLNGRIRWDSHEIKEWVDNQPDALD